MITNLNQLNKRTSNNFDFIRLIAAILVIISHSSAFLGLKQKDLLFNLSRGTYSFSHLGVAIFFIISGYLITQSSLNSSSWKSFLWKRILRLIPGLIVVLLLCAFVLGPIFTNESLTSYYINKETYQFLLSSTLYIQNYSLPGVFDKSPVPSVNGSLWTLAYEFTLYIAVMFGFIFGLFNKRKLLFFLWILFLAFRIYLGNKYFWYSYASPFTLNLNMMYIFEWSFYFLSGMLVFIYKKNEFINYKVLILLLIIYVFFAILNQKEILYVLNYILVPYLVFYLSFLPSKLSEIGKFGDFSYGIYIYAFPVQQMLVYILGNAIPINLFILLSVITTLPFAIASWYLIEKKALKYKNLIK